MEFRDAAASLKTGGRFLRGVVLYTGSEVVPFRAALHAVPVGSLWS